MSGKGPNLKEYLDKEVALQLNKGRKVIGTLRGFDPFMNLAVGNAVEEVNNQRTNIGLVVIRGSSILQLELIG